MRWGRRRCGGKSRIELTELAEGCGRDGVEEFEMQRVMSELGSVAEGQAVNGAGHGRTRWLGIGEDQVGGEGFIAAGGFLSPSRVNVRARRAA